MSSNKNKRKRTSPQEDDGILCITGLPDNAIAHAASYLSKPSRAIFAVAMKPLREKLDCKQSSSSSTVNATDMNHILTSSPKLWETLDFADIEKSLAEKLNDDDMCSILTAIGASANTKCLKITGCVNILGGGLSPLRGSTVLEQIDLSCVGQYEKPDLNPAPLISQQEVIPILASIVRADGTSLAHLQLPFKWRKVGEGGRSTQLTEFLETYDNLVLSRREGKCSKCRKLCREREYFGGWIHRDPNGPYYGLQNHTCSKCLKCFCHECETENEAPWVECCVNCEKYYCIDCTPTTICDKCSESHCVVCGRLKHCEDCGEDFCIGCGPDERDICACRSGEVSCYCCLPDTYECQKEGCNGKYCDICVSGPYCQKCASESEEDEGISFVDRY